MRRHLHEERQRADDRVSHSTRAQSNRMSAGFSVKIVSTSTSSELTKK